MGEKRVVLLPNGGVMGVTQVLLRVIGPPSGLSSLDEHFSDACLGVASTVNTRKPTLVRRLNRLLLQD
eukprot:scaffold253030_cov37-Tisochrysis_lutea.AAC.2